VDYDALRKEVFAALKNFLPDSSGKHHRRPRRLTATAAIGKQVLYYY
jgi:hypothetical protein